MRAQRHRPSPSFSSNLDPVRCSRCLCLQHPHSYISSLSRRRILYEHRRSQLCNFRRQSRAFCWNTRALRSRPSLSGAVPVRADDAQRRAASRDAFDEQHQRAVLRLLVHRKRPVVGVAAESRRRVQPGTARGAATHSQKRRFMCPMHAIVLIARSSFLPPSFLPWPVPRRV